MEIYIDQSGKIEKKNQPSIIGFSNDEKKFIYISRKNKRFVFAFLEEKYGRQKTNILRFFSITVIILLNYYKKKISSVTIDKEYTGREKEIKNYIEQFSKKRKQTIEKEKIKFASIGKNNPAHLLVWKTYRDLKRQKVKIESLSFKEIVNFLL
jgi:hypothetical protein